MKTYIIYCSRCGTECGTYIPKYEQLVHTHTVTGADRATVRMTVW